MWVCRWCSGAVARGLGDERQQWRLLHTIGGGLVLHQLPDPDRLIELAGTIRVPEQAWQLDPGGPAGQARVHMTDRPRIDPNQVRQLHPGEAFLVHGGRAVKLSLLQAPVPANVQEEASALRAAAMGAAEPVYVAEGIAGAPPQVELWRPNPLLDQPDHTAPLPALEAFQEAATADAEAGTPALPALPRQRLLLALRKAVAQRDDATIAAIVQAGRRDAPGWDPSADLDRLRAVGRWRRWRRQPGFLRFLVRVATSSGCAMAERRPPVGGLRLRQPGGRRRLPLVRPPQQPRPQQGGQQRDRQDHVDARVGPQRPVLAHQRHHQQYRHHAQQQGHPETHRRTGDQRHPSALHRQPPNPHRCLGPHCRLGCPG
jgi:hypothetical protein